MADQDTLKTLGHLRVRHLGESPYEGVWRAMTAFTDTRDDSCDDELWLVQHPPVFTQGQAGKAEHLLMPGDIPVVQVDRGGQVTYHGPGQLVAYPLINIKRAKVGVRDLVTQIENTIVALLSHFGIAAYAKPDAPGVYVDQASLAGGYGKIASLGLRIRRGCSFHGVALNVNMDLEPFQRINPCGYAGMSMTQMASLEESTTKDMSSVEQVFANIFAQRLGYNDLEHTTEPWVQPG